MIAHYLRITKQVASKEVLVMVNEWRPRLVSRGQTVF